MREIKFRAWDKAKNKMSNTIGLLDTYAHWRSVMNDDEPVWMQYTGLKDKNGKEIYEGDIIRFIRNDGFENGEVFFEEGKFQVMNFYNQSQDNPCDAFAERVDLEVIGNIYENPELLSK